MQNLIYLNMIRTLLIEDEPQSREMIKSMIRDTSPFIDVVDETGYVEEAVALIKKHQPRLVILDIQLYGRSAFDIFKEITDFDFNIVFITAFEHFAIPAIRLSAVDYILKPVSHIEFGAAMEKVRKKEGLSGQTNNPYKEPAAKINKVVLNDHKEIYLVNPEDLVYFVADGNYTTAVLNNGKKITVAKPIAEFESTLAGQGFYRIHKSYLINISKTLKYIKGRGGEVEMVNGDIIYVSSRRRDEFLGMLKN